MIVHRVAPFLMVFLAACGGGSPRQAEAPAADTSSTTETVPPRDAASQAQATEATPPASESAAPAGSAPAPSTTAAPIAADVTTSDGDLATAPDDTCPDRFPEGAAKILEEKGYRYKVDEDAQRQVVANDFDGDGDCDAAAILTEVDQGGSYRLVTALSGPAGAWRVDDLHGWIGDYSGRPSIVSLPAGAYRKELYGVDMGPSEVDAIDSPRAGFLVHKGDEGDAAFFFDAGKFSFVGRKNERQRREPFFGDVCERLLETRAGTDLAEVERAFSLDPARRRIGPGGPSGGLLATYLMKGEAFFELVVEDAGGGKYLYQEVRLVKWHGRMWQRWRDPGGAGHSRFSMSEIISD